mmetsp:Transcript_830/g.1003  ORF Transcript_830/g.1003 Transcript_830/m.1003 type:complete len:438 (-) Transcript_830:179-1492(-)
MGDEEEVYAEEVYAEEVYAEEVPPESAYGNEGGYGYDNTYTEVTHEGYFSKLGNSFAGICCGIVLFIGAFPLLWWNEGRAVDMYQAINEGRKIVVEVNSTVVDPTNEGKLVHLSGLAEPTQNLTDSAFGVDVTMKIKLSRDVELYQWVENVKTAKKDTVGGGTTTSKQYSYSKQWREYLVDSSRFSKPGYNNPTSMPYTSKDFYSDVIIGAFSLPQTLVTAMSVGSTSLGVTFNTSMIPAYNTLAQSKPESVYGEGFYFGTPSSPQVGDTRVSFDASSGGVVSIIAKQTGNTFMPYEAKSGAELYRLSMGTLNPEEMFEDAKAENKTVTWILRFVGALVMIMGISTILQPLAVAADIIPCVGDCIGAGIGIVATLIGLFLSLVVIGIAWVANRPIILGVAVGGTALVGLLVFNGFRRKSVRSRNLDMPPEKNELQLE